MIIQFVIVVGEIIDQVLYKTKKHNRDERFWKFIPHVGYPNLNIAISMKFNNYIVETFKCLFYNAVANNYYPFKNSNLQLHAICDRIKCFAYVILVGKTIPSLGLVSSLH